MTAQDALDELVGFLAEPPDLEVATVAASQERDGQPEARVLALADDAENFFRSVIASAVVDHLSDASLKALDPVYKPEKDVIEWAQASEIEAIQLAVTRYANLSPLAPFQPGDKAYIQRLRFWVGVLTGRYERRAHFFRAFSSAAELQRKRGAAMVQRDGSFTKVEEQIFLFDDSIDCFVFEGYLFVLRKNDYRRIFDQLEVVRQRARAAAAALHARVPIANFDEFEKACTTQAALADKLIAVQGRDYFSQLSYTMLKPVMDEFGLSIPIQTRNGVPHLVFQTEPQHRWRILRLVDDDFLKSSMTEHRYEVNSKTTPTP